jgi:hypothetical protein
VLENGFLIGFKYMPYTYPRFATVSAVHEEESRRFSLEVLLGTPGEQTWLVIQKNPSRARKGVSDHTINRVLNYLYRNRERYEILRSIGRVVFLNLIPWYETYSTELKHRKQALKDTANLEIIEGYLKEKHPCLVGWGNPPLGLAAPYGELVEEVVQALGKNTNPIYRVGSLTRLGHPRHGQIWGYADPLVQYFPG